jgi:hypothetical protein
MTIQSQLQDDPKEESEINWRLILLKLTVLYIGIINWTIIHRHGIKCVTRHSSQAEEWIRTVFANSACATCNFYIRKEMSECKCQRSIQMTDLRECVINTHWWCNYILNMRYVFSLFICTPCSYKAIVSILINNFILWYLISQCKRHLFNPCLSRIILYNLFPSIYITSCTLCWMKIYLYRKIVFV